MTSYRPRSGSEEKKHDLIMEVQDYPVVQLVNRLIEENHYNVDFDMLWDHVDAATTEFAIGDDIEAKYLESALDSFRQINMRRDALSGLSKDLKKAQAKFEPILKKAEKAIKWRCKRLKNDDLREAIICEVIEGPLQFEKNLNKTLEIIGDNLKILMSKSKDLQQMVSVMNQERYYRNFTKTAMKGEGAMKHDNPDEFNM